MTTVDQAIHTYLSAVALSRSPNTSRTYRNAMNAFRRALLLRGLDPAKAPVGQIQEDMISGFADHLKAYAPASERLYLTAVAGWFDHLAAERMAEVNLPRLRLLIRRRARRPGIRLPQFPETAIERVLEYAGTLDRAPAPDRRTSLLNLRDRAFLLTLGDTGLRVHEACRLRRGDLDMNEGRAVLIGKGDRQAVVRFSQRALRALRSYLSARAAHDGASGRPLSALPVFARHDPAAGEKTLPISTTTGRSIVHARVAEALGPDEVGTITPHSFRHYFVTTVLRGSGGNLKLAQELA
ncbi:MAG TPA: tyrosine-type recombinase/integrase, partial [Anaerolineales bacterium]